MSPKINSCYFTNVQPVICKISAKGEFFLKNNYLEFEEEDDDEDI